MGVLEFMQFVAAALLVAQIVNALTTMVTIFMVTTLTGLTVFMNTRAHSAG